MVNMPGYKISRQNLATSEISDVMACQNCDKTFRSKFVYNFHMENTHPGIKFNCQDKYKEKRNVKIVERFLRTRGVYKFIRLECTAVKI